MPKKIKKPTYAQLERKVMEYHAGLAVVYSHAMNNLKHASTDRRMASGVLLQLTAVGGEEIIPPVMIRDGISNNTLLALRSDIERSRAITMKGV